MPSSTARSAVREFISLEIQQVGFVVYGLGSGARLFQFRGRTLPEFLRDLSDQMWELKDKLNKDWDRLDRQNLESPANREILKGYLYEAAWAYSLAQELAPFAPYCADGPTDPLGRMYLERLEEIFIHCSVAAFIFGSPDESAIALRGLLTDFELGGGVDLKTGGPGRGLGMLEFSYFFAHFHTPNREPIVYQRFGELMEAIGGLIMKKYPGARRSFAEQIKSRLEDKHQGFGLSPSSPPKDAMTAKLSALIDKLLMGSPREAKVG